MADPMRPLEVVTGDPAGMCDLDTGVCVLPDSSAEPESAVSEPQ
jgi:hypothetical protein